MVGHPSNSWASCYNSMLNLRLHARATPIHKLTKQHNRLLCCVSSLRRTVALACHPMNSAFSVFQGGGGQMPPPLAFACRRPWISSNRLIAAIVMTLSVTEGHFSIYWKPFQVQFFVFVERRAALLCIRRASYIIYGKT